MWVDILTKEKKIPPKLEDVLTENKMNLGETGINKVLAFGQEVRMTNIQNRRNSVGYFFSSVITDYTILNFCK